MLKKSITYTNPFTEQEVTEEHWFHISKADMVKMEMVENKTTYRSKDGQEFTGLIAKLQRVIDDEDGAEIMATMEDFIKRSYGEREGDNFRKSPAIFEKFASTEAYSQLFFELCTDAGAAGEFTTGIFPNGLDQEAARLLAQAEAAAGKKVSSDDLPLTEDTAASITGGHPSDPAAQPAPEAPAETGSINTVGTRVLTPAELDAMDPSELKTGLASGKYKLS